ncbi:helix-turn-helix domain-containing protein [Bacillus cereus group sp. IBL03679]|uniref:helix-turn-helix domain-containing protein n=1 Tax=Bacillus cereus group sp. IBL03679 TaxID=3240095 RepID=UPI003D2F7AAB
MTALREFRKLKGYTINEVSKGSKIPVSTLYDVESGRKGLISNRAKSISDFFGEPVENLFFATYYRAKLK